jgi:hypothetical protein
MDPIAAVPNFTTNIHSFIYSKHYEVIMSKYTETLNPTACEYGSFIKIHTIECICILFHHTSNAPMASTVRGAENLGNDDIFRSAGIYEGRMQVTNFTVAVMQPPLYGIGRPPYMILYVCVWIYESAAIKKNVVQTGKQLIIIRLNQLAYGLLTLPYIGWYYRFCDSVLGLCIEFDVV